MENKQERERKAYKRLIEGKTLGVSSIEEAMNYAKMLAESQEKTVLGNLPGKLKNSKEKTPLDKKKIKQQYEEMDALFGEQTGENPDKDSLPDTNDVSKKGNFTLGSISKQLENNHNKRGWIPDEPDEPDEIDRDE